MANLILIGNGFDLAHGMETRYNDFIKYFFEKCYSNVNFCPQLIFPNDPFFSWEEMFKDLLNENTKSTCSLLLKEIVRDYQFKNWCDIEYKYFEFISKLDSIKEEYNIKLLNKDFSLIKNHLEEYLSSLEEKYWSPFYDPSGLRLFSEFFRRVMDDECLFVNFNYTRTLKVLYSIPKDEIIHLHGELKNEENPIIFGIASDEKSLSGLLEKEDSYLENVKRYQYKMTDNENHLWNFINDNVDINLFIIGLSCGLSDKFILNQIFSHPNIKGINLFYYNSKENYKKLIMDIDRIVDGSSVDFKKISILPQSCRTPQNTDNNLLYTQTIAELYSMLEHVIPKPKFHR